jgi:hypothetical protein
MIDRVPTFLHKITQIVTPTISSQAEDAAENRSLWSRLRIGTKRLQHHTEPVVPIDISRSPFLILYGTGIRGAAQANVSVKIGNIDTPVMFAGPQETFAGLDQVNVSLPAALKGRGQLVVTVTVNGQATNMGQVAFQ